MSALKTAIYNPIDFRATPKMIDFESYDLQSIQPLFLKDAIIPCAFRYTNAVSNIRLDMVDAQTGIFSNSGISSNYDNSNTIVFSIPVQYSMLNKTVYFRVSYDYFFAGTTYRLYIYSNGLYKIIEDCNQENYAKIAAYNEHNRNGTFVVRNYTYHFGRTLPVGMQRMPDMNVNSTDYQMSHGRVIPLDTENFEVYEFRFGGKRGVSRSLANAIFFWLHCDNLYIDSVKYRLNKTPEFITIENYERVTVSAHLVKSNITYFEDATEEKPLPDFPIVDNNPTRQTYFEYGYFETDFFE
jgi:hypothetical protein